MGWFQQQTLISHRSRGWEVHGQSAGWFSSWWGLFLACKWPPSCCVLTPWKENELLSLPLLIKTPTPHPGGFTLMTLSKLIISQKPYLPKHRIRDKRFAIWIWAGRGHRQSVQCVDLCVGQGGQNGRLILQVADIFGRPCLLSRSLWLECKLRQGHPNLVLHKNLLRRFPFTIQSPGLCPDTLKQNLLGQS